MFFMYWLMCLFSLLQFQTQIYTYTHMIVMCVIGSVIWTLSNEIWENIFNFFSSSYSLIPFVSGRRQEFFFLSCLRFSSSLRLLRVEWKKIKKNEKSWWGYKRAIDVCWKGKFATRLEIKVCTLIDLVFFISIFQSSNRLL